MLNWIKKKLGIDRLEQDTREMERVQRGHQQVTDHLRRKVATLNAELMRYATVDAVSQHHRAVIKEHREYTNTQIGKRHGVSRSVIDERAKWLKAQGVLV